MTAIGKVRIGLMLAASLQVCLIRAQNLIPNPGFENYNNCPVKPGNAANDLKLWSMPTQGSTDFFHQCSNTMGVPENFNGHQTSKEGRGYVGFYLYAPNDYREYLQVKLKRPLTKDREYTLSYSVSLSERSDFAVTEFDVLFTTQMLNVRTKKQLSKKYWMGQSDRYHFLEGSHELFYADSENWQEIQRTFIATGAERYLILGNFSSNRETRVMETGVSSNKGAYYYLDNVSLTSAEQEPLSESYPLDSLMVLPTLLFDFDAARLTPEGQIEMRKIFKFLSDDASLNLEIQGHTDTIGPAQYNDRLSDERCLAVVRFLKDLGLSSDRIMWKGYGSENPRSDNASPEGRKQNRRVEFRFFVPLPK